MQWLAALFTALGFLVIGNGDARIANAQAVHELRAGSTGNKLTVTLTNPGSEARVGGLKLEVIERPEWLSDLNITDRAANRLGPGEQTRFVLTFNVSPEAQQGSRGTLRLKVHADSGVYPEPSELNFDLAVAKPATKPVAGEVELVLAELKSMPGGSAVDAQGYFHRLRDERTDVSASFKLTQLPETIVLGRPFTLGVELLYRARYTGLDLHTSRSGEQRNWACMSDVGKPDSFERIAVMIEGPDFAHSAYGEASTMPFCSELRAQSRLKREGRVALDIDFEPSDKYSGLGATRVASPSGDVDVPVAAYAYRLTTRSQGEVYRTWGDAGLSQTDRITLAQVEFEVSNKSTDDPLRIAARPHRTDYNRVVFTFRLPANTVHIFGQERPGIEAVYLPREAGIRGLQAYEHPDLGPEDEPQTPGVAGGETAERPTELSRLPSPRPDDFSVRPEPFSEADGIVVASALNPLDPEVMQHMREWLSIAEPPENATGADLRYTTWGQVEGTVPGGRITATRPPDEVGNRTAAEYLWSKRDQLPSLDHCTLGVYVVARLNRASIDHCKSARLAATGVLLIDVEGMPALQAKQALERQRLQVTLNLAEPAPTSEQASVVKMQQPVSGTRLKGKDVVTLDVYGDYAPPVVIPKLMDQSGAAARRMLADLGLNPTLRTIGTAPSAAKAFRVFDVAPGEGATVRPNSPVAISAYGPYEDRVAMPDIIGMDYQEAGRILSALGLNPTLQGGNDVSDQGKAYKIYKQEPVPGTKITPRQTVQLSYHGRYVFRGKMPNLQGLAQSAALVRVDALPFRVLVQQGEPAPAPRQSGTVAAQSIPPGREITEGESLALTVFDTSIEEQLAAANCSVLPGTVAAWDAAGRKAVCNCRPNLKRAVDGMSCGALQKQQMPPDPGWASLPPGGGVGDDFARRQEEERRRRQWEEQQRRRQRAEEEARRQEQEWAERARQERECGRVFQDAIHGANRGQFDFSYGALRHAVGLGCDPADADRVHEYIRRRQSSMPRSPWTPPPSAGMGPVRPLPHVPPTDPRAGYRPPPTEQPPVTRPSGKVIPGFGDGMGRRPPPTGRQGGWIPPLNKPPDRCEQILFGATCDPKGGGFAFGDLPPMQKAPLNPGRGTLGPVKRPYP